MRDGLFSDSLWPEPGIATGRRGGAMQDHRMLGASGRGQQRPDQQQADMPAATGTTLVGFQFTDRPQVKDNSPAAAGFLFRDEAKTAPERRLPVPPQALAWPKDICRDAQTRGRQRSVLFSHDSGPRVSRYQIPAGSPPAQYPLHHTGDAE